MRRPWGRWLLGATFVVAGVLHLAVPDLYLVAMPPGVPAPHALVLLSGAFEVLGGAGVLWPSARVRRVAGWGLALLLVAVYPANVHLALQGGPSPLAEALLLLRLPLQGAFVAWALRASGAVPASS